MNHSGMDKKQMGMSRTDLFIMIAILGFLALLRPVKVRDHSECCDPLRLCKSNLKHIATGVEIYSSDWGGAFPPSTANLTPNYLRTVPTCPAAGADTYSEHVQVDNRSLEQGSYLIYCAGDHHSDVGVPADYPLYDSVVGWVERPEPEEPQSDPRCESVIGLVERP